MPVEIREVIIRAELAPRKLTTTAKSIAPALSPEIISALRSLCAEELEQISKTLPKQVRNKKFDR